MTIQLYEDHFWSNGATKEEALNRAQVQIDKMLAGATRYHYKRFVSQKTKFRYNPGEKLYHLKVTVLYEVVEVDIEAENADFDRKYGNDTSDTPNKNEPLCGGAAREDTHEEHMEGLRVPPILVRGGDYRHRLVVGNAAFWGAYLGKD
jgi:hypothetical protein